MKIVLDGRPAFGGIHRVVRGLVVGLRTRSDLCDVDVIGDTGGNPVTPDHQLTPLRRALRPWLGNARRLAADQIGLGWSARRRHPDLVHSPHGVVPIHPLRPWIASLWDLSPITAEFVCGPPLMRRYRSWCFRRAVAHADHLIVPSEAVRRTLIARFGVSGDHITRIYPLFGPHLQPANCALPEPRHLLHVGTLEPRKNLDRLLDAMELIGPTEAPPLLLAGRYGWRQEGLLARVAAAGESVRWLGEVDDQHLADLYRQAAVVIQPSRHEGFDLPVLEGLAAGVPVVVSDIPVHREVAADCAIFAPVDDAAALAAAIREALGWRPEQRQLRGAAARALAAKLMRADPALEHIEVYRNVRARCLRPFQS